uniref:Oxidoreductase n=1 Tax=Caenorhabditis tropicalis TaxID=1561998 RepID=A0A1I7UMU1_9PELO
MIYARRHTEMGGASFRADRLPGARRQQHVSTRHEYLHFFAQTPRAYAPDPHRPNTVRQKKDSVGGR